MKTSGLLDEIRKQQDKIEALEAELAQLHGVASIRPALKDESRIQDFMDSLADWFWEMNADLRFTYISPNIERILGHPPEFFYGKTHADIHGEGRNEKSWKIPMEIFQAKKPFRNMVFSSGMENQGIRWLSASGVPVFDTETRFQGYRGTCRDVTDWIIAQEKAVAQEAHFRKLIENSLLGIFVHRNFEPLFVNTAFANMLGYDSSEHFRLEVRSIRDIIHPGEVIRLVDFNQRRNQGEDAPLIYDSCFLQRCGTPIWIQLAVQVIEWEGERSMLSFCNDISLRKSAEAESEERQRLLEAVLNTLPMGIAVKGVDGTYLKVNREMAEFYGLTVEEMTGKTTKGLPFRSGGFGDVIIEEDRKVFEKRELIVHEAYEVSRPSGEKQIRYLAKFPMLNESGQVERMVVVSQNITEQKKAERALIESQALLAKAQEVGHFGHLEWDVETDRQVWSDEVFRILGYAPQSFTADPARFAEILHPDDKKMVLKAIDHHFYQDAPFDLECRVIHADGGERTLHAQGELMRGEDGRPLRMIGTVHDITERIRAEAALRQSRNIMDMAQGMGHFGSIEWDQTHNYHFWTDETFRILGYTPGDVEPSARAFLLAVHPEDRKRIEGMAQATFRNGAKFETRYRILRLDGSERVVEGRAEMIRDDPWQTPRLVGTIHDVTEAVRMEEALQANEASLRLITDSLPVLIAFLDKDHRYGFTNRQFYEWFGADPKDNTGRHIREVIGDAAYQRLLPKIEQGFSGQIVAFEDEIPYRDGGSRWVQIQYVPQRDEDGSVSGLFAMASDLSSIKRTERALQESEERFKSTVDNIPSAVFIKDLEGRYLYVNRLFETWWGINNQSAFGRTTDELFPNKEALQYRRLDKEMLETGLVQEEEVLLPLADGSRRIMRNTKFPISDADGKIKSIGSIITDIHSQKEAESALSDSRERLQQAARLARLGYWIWNTDMDRCQYCSEEHALIHDISVSEYLMLASSLEGLTSLVHPEDRDGYLVVRHALREGRGFDIEYRVVTQQGDVRHVREIARPILDDKGRVIRERGTTLDITEGKLQESHLRQTQKMEAIGQLAGGVAHDFNNLLQVILGYAGLLLGGGDLSEFQRENLGEIKGASERAASLTQQLLAFGRKQTLQFAPHDVNDLITHQSRMVQRVIGENIQLNYRPQAHNSMVQADGGMLEQVLLNLIINARDAMPDGGTLSVSTDNVEPDAVFRIAHRWAVEDSYIRITVEDTGRGMSPEVQERIFEPFFTTKNVGEGTGLGLAMAYGIIRQHGGMIDVTSTPGEGSSFHIYLIPALSSPDFEEIPPQPKIMGGSETILVVEDEIEVLRLVSFLLTGEGYTVIQAGHGKDALEVMERQGDEIDLALVDVMMPTMSGREFFERSKSRWPRCKMIFTTGYAADAIDHQFLSSHDLRLMVKPYLPDDLYRIVREVLEAD